LDCSGAKITSGEEDINFPALFLPEVNMTLNHFYEGTLYMGPGDAFPLRSCL
jgi:hypothetical protein